MVKESYQTRCGKVGKTCLYNRLYKMVKGLKQVLGFGIEPSKKNEKYFEKSVDKNPLQQYNSFCVCMKDALMIRTWRNTQVAEEAPLLRV